MDSLVETKNVFDKDLEFTVETYLSDKLPSPSDCSSAYSFVFKDGSFLQTELREGERPQRMFDIPGGHIEDNETIEEAVIRETFEETGVIVKIKSIVAYKKVTVIGPKPENFRYPYPVSYMVFYLCEVVEETPFDGNEETHGRVWLSKEDFGKPGWCLNNKILFEKILKLQNI